MLARRTALHGIPLVTFSSDLVFGGEKIGPYDEDDSPYPLGVYGRTKLGREVRCADDATASPTYVPDLVHTALDLAIDGERGLWHLVNSGAVTAAQLVRLAARGCGISTASLASVPQQALGGCARRPRNSALGSSRGMLLPPLEHALERYPQDLSQARGPR